MVVRGQNQDRFPQRFEELDQLFSFLQEHRPRVPFERPTSGVTHHEVYVRNYEEELRAALPHSLLEPLFLDSAQHGKAGFPRIFQVVHTSLPAAVEYEIMSIRNLEVEVG